MRTRIVFCLLALALSVCDAQWVQTNGPYGVPVNSFVVKGTYIFAGTDCGVFLSKDNGLTWTVTGLNDNGFPLPVNTLVVNATSLFAACGGRSHERGSGSGDVFRSTDDGATWTRLKRFVADYYGSHQVSEPVYTLAIHDSILFAGGWGFNWSAGLYASTNNGTSWSLAGVGLNDDLGNPFCIRLLFSNGDRLFAHANGSVYVSTNNGASWALTGSSLPNATISCMTVHGAYLIAGTSIGVYRSSNNGDSWATVIQGLTGRNVTSLTSRDTTLYVGVAPTGPYPATIFRSTNVGETWEVVNQGLDCATLRIGSLAACGGTLLAGTHDVGVFRSTNGGTSWGTANFGMRRKQVMSLAMSVDRRSLYAGTRNGVYRSEDNGTTWRAAGLGSLSYDNPVLGLLMHGHQPDSTFLLAATAYNGVLTSTNNGTSWIGGGLSAPEMGTYFMIASLSLGSSGSENTNIFAGCVATHDRGDMVSNSPGGVYRSTDNGTTWSNVSTGLPADVPWGGYCSVNSLVLRGNSLFAGTNHGVFVSTDNATSWNPAHAGLTDDRINVIAVSGSTLFAGTAGGGIFRSTDDGGLWVSANDGLSDSIITSLAVSGSTVFSGTHQRGLFLTTSSGTRWMAVGEGLDSCIAALTVGDSWLFAGTPSGVWRRPLTEMTTDIRLQRLSPAQYALSQNYPNPFNPTTNIQFSIVNRQLTIVKVYDVLGREVATLVNEVKDPGTYTVQFDAAALSTGVYFYRLSAGDFIQTKKLLLAK